MTFTLIAVVAIIAFIITETRRRKQSLQDLKYRFDHDPQKVLKAYEDQVLKSKQRISELGQEKHTLEALPSSWRTKRSLKRVDKEIKQLNEQITQQKEEETEFQEMLAQYKLTNGHMNNSQSKEALLKWVRNRKH